MTFHGEERFRHARPCTRRASRREKRARASTTASRRPKESPWVVTVPLILLAIPSVLAGWIAIEPLLFGGYFGSSIVVLPEHDVLGKLQEEWHGVGAFIAHSFTSPVLWIAVAGVASAIYMYLCNPALPARVASAGRRVHAARQQLLLRPLQRVVLRRRRTSRGKALQRTWATARSSKASSTARRAWSDGRASVLRQMQSGLRLPLRVHDDHRVVRAPDLVGGNPPRSLEVGPASDR